MIYESIPQYLETCESLAIQIDQLDLILAQMRSSMIAVAANPELGISAQSGVSMTEEYSLDDGQTKIRTKYRDAASLVGAMESLMRLKNLLISQLNNNNAGRVFRLMDSRNFIG